MFIGSDCFLSRGDSLGDTSVFFLRKVRIIRGFVGTEFLGLEVVSRVEGFVFEVAMGEGRGSGLRFSLGELYETVK